MPIKLKKKIKLLTIGFTKKTAQEFFELLINNQVKTVIDTRLNNVSQLAGFTKKKDLAYFLEKIAQIEYYHRTELAPTKEILTEYQKNQDNWPIYSEKFLKLLEKRKIEQLLNREMLNNSCLLCSEAEPHFCHRRLVAEYLQEKWGEVEIIHL